MAKFEEIAVKEVRDAHWLVTVLEKKGTEDGPVLARRIVGEFYGPGAQEYARVFAGFLSKENG